MEAPCPRCYTANPEAARYCRRCGLLLVEGPSGPLGPGRVRHPQPLPTPDGFQPLADGADLLFRNQAAGGGTALSGTEGLTITIFNAGYPLTKVTVRIRGEDRAGGAVFAVERSIADLPRGKSADLEIASWELPEPAERVIVTLVSAEFGPDA
jgi:hypothetical protein